MSENEPRYQCGSQREQQSADDVRRAAQNILVRGARQRSSGQARREQLMAVARSVFEGARSQNLVFSPVKPEAAR